MTLASFTAVCRLLYLFTILVFVYRFLSDLKPENLLFRTPQEDADIMLADFGLSRIMEEEKLNMLTEICGTPGVSKLCLCQTFSFVDWLAFVVYGARNF
jgi:hypothetical protein